MPPIRSSLRHLLAVVASVACLSSAAATDFTAGVGAVGLAEWFYD